MSKIYTEDGVQEALKRLDDRLEKIESRLTEIDRTLLVNTSSLEKHMLRTELSEKRLEKIENELIPVSRHVSQVSGALKFVGILSLVTGFIYTAVKLVSEFVN
jgi:tetrahydromethanopterin S-methyltransferase subunit G